MYFFKKVVVLKQVSENYSVGGKTVSGILRCESDCIITDVYLSLINLSASKKGEYFLFILPVKGDIVTLPLGKRPTSFKSSFDNLPVLSNGFSTGIFFIEDDIPDLVLYAETENCVRGISDLKKAVLDNCITERKIRQKEEKDRLESESEKHGEYSSFTQTDSTAKSENTAESVYEPPVIPPVNLKKPSDFSVYDDEVVATENYFEKDYDNVRNENDDAVNCGEEKTKKGFTMPGGFSNEEIDAGGENYSEQNPYFDTVKSELDDIFEKFPEVTELKNCVPYSKWAKINYSEEKYYVVGVVSDGNKLKYICYGVPAKYSPDPPEELKGFCSFVPISVFDMNGDGYWMMFQDAVTGNCVHLNEHS